MAKAEYFLKNFQIFAKKKIQKIPPTIPAGIPPDHSTTKRIKLTKRKNKKKMGVELNEPWGRTQRFRHGDAFRCRSGSLLGYGQATRSAFHGPAKREGPHRRAAVATPLAAASWRLGRQSVAAARRRTSIKRCHRSVDPPKRNRPGDPHENNRQLANQSRRPISASLTSLTRKSLGGT